jgi:excinuclease ABC subunit C
LLLIDGGITHANAALGVLNELGLHIPVFGMVKDNKHRTRALVTPYGDEIRIDNQQVIFAFIGTIQEETHRFAIMYHRQLRSKRLKYSELDQIPGIGQKRKQDLLKHFKSITAIGSASLDDLELILPAPSAMAVYSYFRQKTDEKENI